MIYQYLDTKPEFAVPFNGWVADTARVIGDVYLGCLLYTSDAADE